MEKGKKKACGERFPRRPNVGTASLRLPGRMPGLEVQQLPDGLGAAQAVVLEVTLFGLALDALLLLKLLPAGAGLVAAFVKRGTVRLTGKHTLTTPERAADLWDRPPEYVG